MRPTEPSKILLREVQRSMAEAIRPLREQGWDVHLSVVVADESEDHFFTVTASVKIGHSMPIPFEARAS